MESVRKAVLQNWRFTVSELSGHSPQMSRSLLNEIISRWQEKFHNDGEVHMEVTSWVQMLAVASYDTGKQTLMHRYDKCLNKSGSYIEK